MSRRAFFRQLYRADGSSFSDSRIKLAILFTAAIVIAFFVNNGNAVAGAVFQSPQSPIESLETPLDSLPPIEAQPPAQEGPALEQAPAPADSLEAPTDVIPPATEQESQPETVPQAPPVPEPREESARENRTIESSSSDSSNLILDRAEFIDSVVVSFAYMWLCCGVALILVIPLIFLFLQIRGRSRLKKGGL